MRRALAGVGAVAVLLTGCSSISESDEAACDFLFRHQQDAIDEDDAALRPSMEIVVADARRLARGGKAKYFDLHIGDALSLCMDGGW